MTILAHSNLHKHAADHGDLCNARLRSGIVDRLARRVFGSKTSKRMGLLRMQSLVFVLSGFFNNTPIVALLLPITRDWARSRGFAPSQFLIPLSYVTIAGGLLTLIGTSTNLVVQGLLEDNDKEQFGFFDPALVGLPLGVLMITYLTTVGQSLLPENRGGMFRLVRDRTKELITEAEILNSFPLVGRPVEVMLEQMQLQSSALLKIRRRCQVVGDTSKIKKLSPAVRDDSAAAAEETKDTSRLDMTYVRRTYGLWYGEGERRSSENVQIERALSDSAQQMLATPSPLNPKRERSHSLELADLKKSAAPKPQAGGDAAPLTQPRQERNDTDMSEIQVLVEHPNNSEPQQETIARRSVISMQREDRDEYYFDIFPVPEGEIVHEGDIMYFTHPKALMELHDKRLRQGLKILDTNVLELAGFGTDLVELVISDTNPFNGQTIYNNDFAKRYNVSIIALRSRGADEVTNVVDLRTTILRPGDIVLVVATEDAYKGLLGSRDFYVVTRVGSVPPATTYWDYVACLVFVAMLIVVALDLIPIVQACITVMMIMIFGGWVAPGDAIKSIDFRLLCLIGSALGFARSIQASGLDDDLANLVKSADLPPQAMYVPWLSCFCALCSAIV